MGRRLLLRLALGAALAGCASSSPPPLRAAVAPPYEVPGDPREAALGGRGAGQDAAGPIPVTDADPVRGEALAPVTMVEFADFQCPFCQRGAETVAALLREYGPAKLRFVWKNFPLTGHREARPAAEVGMALLAQGGAGRFFVYHDAIFFAQRALGKRLFDDAVTAAGSTPEEIGRFVREGAASRKVEADEQLGRRLGVTGTPAFFINGVMVHGAQPIEKFRAVIDEALVAARAAVAGGTPPGRVYAEMSARNFVPPRPSVAEGEPEKPDLVPYRVPVGSSPSRGVPSALVTIVEFADFQCPYCARAEEALGQIAAKYGVDVRVVWKNLPLPFHDHAEIAGELAFEARAQRGDAGFWKVHDLLLAQRGRIDDAALAAVAKDAGLDVDRALRAVQKHAHQAAMDEDSDLAEEVQVTGTPTFFVNGRKVVGALPFDAFLPIVEEQLAAARATVARGVPAARVYEMLQQAARLAPLETTDVLGPPPSIPGRGPEGAKVVVQMWSDLECPFCKRVEPTLRDLEAAFPGRIRIVWHNHPLPIHPHAMQAAEAVMEAFAQKGAAGFWKMHDLVLENQGGAGQERAALEQYAATVGLDLARFRAALDGSVHRAAIEADGKAAEAAGLPATPGFAITAGTQTPSANSGSIHGYRVSGAQSLSRFRRVVRRALQEAK
jgi:protein-disulfide isomerase